MSRTSNPAGNPKISGPTTPNGNQSGAAAKPPEFGAFEELTRKLVNVSKTELDEKRGK